MTKSKGPMLCIVLEGGMVQSVVTNDLNALSDLQIMVIDYDTDGADDRDLIQVRQQDGKMAEAYGHHDTLEQSGIDLGEVAAAIDEKDART